MAISFAGVGEIEESLAVSGWLTLRLEPDLRQYVDWWVRFHECSRPAYQRGFEVRAGTFQVDHWVEIRCQACTSVHKAFGQDVRARPWGPEPLPPLERPRAEPRSERVTGVRLRPAEASWKYLPEPVRWAPEKEARYAARLTLPGEPVEPVVMHDVITIPARSWGPFSTEEERVEWLMQGEDGWMDWDRLPAVSPKLHVEIPDWASW